jgi:hypothetical protein
MGHHVLGSSSPYSCLVPVRPELQGRADRHSSGDVPGFVGIDVAQAQLDIAVRPSGERWAVPHDAGGVVTLVERLQTCHPTLMVLEATGGLSGSPRRRWPRRASPSSL